MAPIAYSVVWRKVRFSFVLASGIFAVTASAQINEQDRLHRCENNQARIVQIRARLKGMHDEAEVARGRELLNKVIAWRDQMITARRSMLNLEAAVSEHRIATDDYDRWYAEASKRYEAAQAAFRAETARTCDRSGERECIAYLGNLIDGTRKAIAQAEAFAPTRSNLLQQLAAAQSNWIALRCDLPAQVATLPDLAGTWYREGRTSLPTSIAENGQTLVFTNEMKPPMVSRGHFVSAGEAVADQWEGGLIGIVSPDLRHIAWRNGTNWSR